jgi:hypothetical protein
VALTRARGDSGAIAANVAVVPILMTVLFMVMQVSLWYYGRAVATAAAQHGLDSARVAGGTEGSGKSTVYEFVDQTGGLDITNVAVVRSPTLATVTIEGNVATIVPFFDVPVSVNLAAPVERIVE